MSTESPQASRLREDLNAIRPGVYSDLEQIASFPVDIGMAVLCLLVGAACQSQHIVAIRCAMEALSRLPMAWIERHLPVAISATIDIDDYWEFRRALEMLDEIAPSMATGYARKGLLADGEVREAAQDWFDRHGRKP